MMLRSQGVLRGLVFITALGRLKGCIRGRRSWFVFLAHLNQRFCERKLERILCGDFESVGERVGLAKVLLRINPVSELTCRF